ncbi:MAG: hypothetical protein R2753_14980 [Chitinophagales bacterium]
MVNGSTSNNTGLFTGLAAGNYTGTVTDANGMFGSICAAVISGIAAQNGVNLDNAIEIYLLPLFM